MFANIASFGMSGLTDRLVNQSKKRFGSLSFFAATAKAPADGVDLTINTVAIANGRYFGGGMMVAPDASLDDGEFDVVAIGDMSMTDFVLKSRRMYAGTHLSLEKVSHRRARVVRATPAEPGQVVELDVDGETPGILPATFTVVPRALDLIAPEPGRGA